MLTFQCSNCTKTLRVNDEHAGKRVACTCGQKMVVPGASTASAGQPVTTGQSSTKIQVACQQCGTKLAAPASAVGKAVKCKCGAVVPIRAPGSNSAPRANPSVTATPVSAAPAPFASPAYPSGEADIFGNLSAADLGTTNNWQQSAAPDAAYYAPPSSPYTPTPAPYSAAGAYSAGGAYPAGGSYGNSGSTRSKKGAATNAYLANAAQELEKERQGERISWNPFNETTLAGVAMIGGAVAWFVGGLFFGIIFFYPPILLVLGMITLGRGLMASDN